MAAMTAAPPPYEPPAWSSVPSQNGWKLSEIKGGVEVASYSLDNKSCIVLGRAADMVDIVLQHESCSRRHARIGFDKENGTPWLRDLGSAHGTKVNRNLLPPQAVGSVESDSRKTGSRGVILYVGDIIQFGASTRLYCLEGPVEYERGAVLKVKPDSKKTAVSMEPIREQKAAALVIPRRSDLEAEYEDEEALRASNGASAKERSIALEKLNPMDVPDKHRKLWERLRARQYKLANIQQESERIRAKGELTEGQQNQLAKNAEREMKMSEEIEGAERELHGKIFKTSTEQPSSNQQKKATRLDEDDVDDFYDRTKNESSSHPDAGEGETEEDLVAKWKYQCLEWTRLSAPADHAQTKMIQLGERIQSKAADDDDLFFLQNELDLARDELRRSQERMNSLEVDLKDTERLLRVVNGRLVFDRFTGYVGNEDTVRPYTPSSSRRDPNQEKPSGKASSPPSSSAGAPPKTSEAMLPPPKRARIAGPSMPPPVARDRISMPPPQQLKQKPGPPVGTLSVLSSSSTRKLPGNTVLVVDEKGQKRKKVPSFNAKKDEWRAPDGQDGSGITKLNEKFAGRY